MGSNSASPSGDTVCREEHDDTDNVPIAPLAIADGSGDDRMYRLGEQSTKGSCKSSAVHRPPIGSWAAAAAIATAEWHTPIVEDDVEAAGVAGFMPGAWL